MLSLTCQQQSLASEDSLASQAKKKPKKAVTSTTLKVENELTKVDSKSPRSPKGIVAAFLIIMTNMT